MASKITHRISIQTGIPDLFAALTDEIPPSDLQSLMMDVYRARADDAQPSNLLARTRSNALLKPSAVDARMFTAFDRVAFESAADFDAIDLSPVCVLGAHHGLGLTSQNNILSTIRNSEVLGDPTVALALEAALRRKTYVGEIRLCASHRVVRLQPFDVEGFSPHFRLFVLVTAGRDTGSFQFEMQHLQEHLAFYLQLFRGLGSQGFAFPDPLVEISDMSAIGAALSAAGVAPAEVRELIRAHNLGGSEKFLQARLIALSEDIHDPRVLSQIREEVFEPLRTRFPEADFRMNPARLEGLGYYSGFIFRVSARADDGSYYPLIDGGMTDWTARLLSNRKERLLISGIGTEFACKRYRAA
ncbi:MAG: hypothetical protein ABSB35_12070 [Bryobacteraceae bacterium]|jgi:hypothetical protein